MSEEKIGLKLDYGESQKATIDLASVLDKLKAAAEAAGHQGFAELISKTKETTEALKEVGATAEETGPKTKLGLAEIGQGASGLFSALKEGNVGGAIRSVSEVISLVPALNTFAPAIKAAGTAAEVAWPMVKEWFEYLSKTNEKLVDSTKSIQAYANALEEANDALKETDALEKARAEDKAAKEEIGNRQKERGETFETLTKGRKEETLQEVFDAVHGANADYNTAMVKQIKEKYEKALQEYVDRSGGDTSSVIYKGFQTSYGNMARQEIAKIQTGEKDQAEAEDLIAKAKTGDERAINRLREILPEGSTTREIARMASPEAQDEARAAKRDVAEQEQMHREQQAFERREADRKKAEAQAQADAAEKELESLAEELNNQDVLGRPKPPTGKRPGMIQENQTTSELPQLDIHNEITQGLTGLPTSRPGLPSQLAPLLEQVIKNQADAAQNDGVRLEQLQRAAQQVGGAIQSNRSAQNNGTF